MGDLDKPKLAFVFDEAHLLFDNASPALMQRIEQVVRLIPIQRRRRLLLLAVP
jgi:hypothetical protein